MRPAARAVVAVSLLAGPTVLAFFQGGYFAEERLVALVLAHLALALALLVGDPRALRDRPALLAVGGLGLLAAWTAASAAWAPLQAEAIDARERTLLYLAVVAAAALLLGAEHLARRVEPALAAGITVVVGYGVLGHAGVFHVTSTVSAGGRLDQPLTYWNAEGALAAMGLVLAARLAGSRERPLALRAAAAAAAPLLGAGVYLTFSRGALTALAVGLAVLVATSPTWAQLRSLAIALEGAVLAVAAFEVLPDRVAVAVLAGVMLLAAAGQAWSARAEGEQRTRTGPLPWAPRLRAVAWVVAALVFLAPFGAAVADPGDPANPAFGATAERLGSAGSHRYAYWEVALRTFADEPAIGVGAGGFGTAWLAEREIDENVRDAHSLPLETAAELGAIGLLCLALLVAGVVLGLRRLGRAEPTLATGPAAALAVWAAHASVDWDWEMPALTLVAAVLAGFVVARGYHRAPS